MKKNERKKGGYFLCGSRNEIGEQREAAERRRSRRKKNAASVINVHIYYIWNSKVEGANIFRMQYHHCFTDITATFCSPVPLPLPPHHAVEQYVWHIDTNDTLAGNYGRSGRVVHSKRQKKKSPMASGMDCSWLRWLKTHIFVWSELHIFASFHHSHPRTVSLRGDGINTADARAIAMAKRKCAMKTATVHTRGWAGCRNGPHSQYMYINICICGHTRHVRRFPLLSIQFGSVE